MIKRVIKKQEICCMYYLKKERSKLNTIKKKKKHGWSWDCIGRKTLLAMQAVYKFVVVGMLTVLQKKNKKHGMFKSK